MGLTFKFKKKNVLISALKHRGRLEIDSVVILKGEKNGLGIFLTVALSLTDGWCLVTYCTSQKATGKTWAKSLQQVIIDFFSSIYFRSLRGRILQSLCETKIVTISAMK